MTDLVLDASVTLALCFPEERTPSLLTLQESLSQRAAVVPALWWFEVASGLLMAKRRARLDLREFEGVLKVLRQLPVSTDPHGPATALTEVIELAERFGLTAYDAAYLELAARRRLPLATLDKELRRAAAAVGIELEPN